VMPPGPDLAEGAPSAAYPHPRVLLPPEQSLPDQVAGSGSAGAAMSAGPSATQSFGRSDDGTPSARDCPTDGVTGPDTPSLLGGEDL
jgi:hypothetical protein